MTRGGAQCRLYGEEALYFDRDQAAQWAWPRLTRWLERKIQNQRVYKERASYRIIHGHFPPQKYRKTLPHAHYITFFRQPVQRVVSAYFYMLRTPDQGLHNQKKRKLIEENLNLKDYVTLMWSRRDIRKIYANYALTYFDFVGITEHYEASLRLLKARLIPALDLPIKPQLINPSKAIHVPYDLDEETLAFLNAYLAPLIERYEEALNHFRRECAAEGIVL